MLQYYWSRCQSFGLEVGINPEEKPRKNMHMITPQIVGQTQKCGSVEEISKSPLEGISWKIQRTEQRFHVLPTAGETELRVWILVKKRHLENILSFPCVCQSLSHVRLCATPWTVVHQAPLSTGFPWQSHQKWISSYMELSIDFIKKIKLSFPKFKRNTSAL